MAVERAKPPLSDVGVRDVGNGVVQRQGVNWPALSGWLCQAHRQGWRWGGIDEGDAKPGGFKARTMSLLDSGKVREGGLPAGPGTRTDPPHRA